MRNKKIWGINKNMESGVGRIFGFPLASFFSFSLFIFLASCAREMRGAGSISLPQPISEPFIYPAYELLPVIEGFSFGFGASNLKPYLFGGYSHRETTFGITVAGIPFSGIRIKYYSGSADISGSKTIISEESGRFAVGLGLGGNLASDENFSEEGKRHSISELHSYLSSVLSWWPNPDSSLSMFLSFKLGYYYVKSTFLRSLLEKKQQEGEIQLREVTDNFSGLFFTPSAGLMGGAIGGKIGWFLSLSLPLSAALIYEPDLHPFVPSLNFGFIIF